MDTCIQAGVIFGTDNFYHNTSFFSVTKTAMAQNAIIPRILLEFGWIETYCACITLMF